MPAVIVIGGHRYGTSAVAGAISHLGIPAALPGDEIGASLSNPRGHFEDRTLVRLHQRMLGTGGWRNPVPPVIVAPELLARYDAHLRRRAAAAERWLVKDPRLCLLLPVLLSRLLRASVHVAVVSVSRDVQAATESLRRRQRMPQSAAVRIAWLYEGARRAQLAMLAAVTTIPVLRLDSDQVLEDRHAAVTALAQFLGVEPTAAAVEFLEPSLRHGSQ